MDVLKCSSSFDLPWANIVDKVGTERGRIYLVPHSFPPIPFMRSNVLQATQQRESLSTPCVVFLKRSFIVVKKRNPSEEGKQERGMGGGWLSQWDGVIVLGGVKALRRYGKSLWLISFENAGYAYQAGEVAPQAEHWKTSVRHV